MFLPWHREFMRMTELLLREIDPTVTLHYWDWTFDPTQSHTFNSMTFPAIFNSSFMGNSTGNAGWPLVSHNGTDPNLALPLSRLYDPTLTADNAHREKTTPPDPDKMTWDYTKPPNHMTRDYKPNLAINSEATTLSHGDLQPTTYPHPNQAMPKNGEYAQFCNRFFNGAHISAHDKLGADAFNLSSAFRDPMPFFCIQILIEYSPSGKGMYLSLGV